MSYYRERLDGTPVLHPHKHKTILKNKIIALLAHHSLDDVLSEIAAQRPAFDIHIRVADRKLRYDTSQIETFEQERSA